MGKILVIFSVLLSYFCSLSNAADYEVNFGKPLEIIGGEESVPHAHPYQVALLINSQSLCGGTLISQNYVLTAAHCAEAVNSSLDIILGAHNIREPETTQVHIQSDGIKIHERYNYRNYNHDIALIKLKQPAPLSNVINTIPLPTRADADDMYYDHVATSLGWGLTNDTAFPTLNDTSNVLMEVDLSIVFLQECISYYNDFFRTVHFVTELNLCTSGQFTVGTCFGDSGGPLILDGKQIGIVSIEPEMCESNSPSVYTHVGKYLDWIEKNSDVVIH